MIMESGNFVFHKRGEITANADASSLCRTSLAMVLDIGTSHRRCCSKLKEVFVKLKLVLKAKVKHFDVFRRW